MEPIVVRNRFNYLKELGEDGDSKKCIWVQRYEFSDNRKETEMINLELKHYFQWVKVDLFQQYKILNCRYNLLDSGFHK